MNAFSVLAAAYGIVGAFSLVTAKISLHRRVRKKGLSARDFPVPYVWTIDKEASSDLIDIFTFAMIGISFLFAIFAEFTSYTDWLAGVSSNLPIIVVLFFWVLYTVVVESPWPYSDGDRTWTLVIQKWELSESPVFPILSIIALLSSIIYLLAVRADTWFLAGLVIPQIVLAAAFIILTRSSWIFKRNKSV
jgi:hypothetical protein